MALEIPGKRVMGETPPTVFAKLFYGIRSQAQKASAALFAPVDVASLVYFRIAFGAIMLWEIWRYFQHGWIAAYWIEPEFHFHYLGFEWLKPWPGNGMYLHFIALGVLALMIMTGLWYRASTILFFTGFTYTFLLEQARYLNHFYLICLISFLLIFMPANAAFSVDARRHPGMRKDHVPAWSLWLLRFQIAVPYFYGGIAKLNADWLSGKPLNMWLAERSDFPLIGAYFQEDWMVLLFSYGGLLFDILVVPFLLWRRTRFAAFCLALGFHLINARLFSIGIFPWFMIAATLLFFDPGWPRQVARIVKKKDPPGPKKEAAAVHITNRGAVLTLLSLYVGIQILFPLRHFLYPGNVNWSEEGHVFSWHMKLRDKEGDAVFLVTDVEGETTRIVQPAEHLTSWQQRKMSTRPELILQFAHYLAQLEQQNGTQAVEVRTLVRVSLNGRPSQLLVDPRADLAAQAWSDWPHAWILPLLN